MYISCKNLKSICQDFDNVRSFLFFSTRKEWSSFTKRDYHLQDSIELKLGVIISQPLRSPRGESCLISTPERVTIGFSASEHAKSLLGLILGGGAVNPCRLV